MKRLTFGWGLEDHAFGVLPLPLLHIRSDINLVRKARPMLRMQEPIRVRNLCPKPVSPNTLSPRIITRKGTGI